MFGEPAMWWDGKKIDPARVIIKVNTRSFRKSLDEVGVESGFVDQDEVEARALGRTLEEIDELETNE